MKTCVGIIFRILLLMLVITSLTLAQSHYYYSHREKIPLTISEEEITIKFKTGLSDSEIQSNYKGRQMQNNKKSNCTDVSTLVY